MIVTSKFELQRVAPPALPQATLGYSKEYQEQLNNVLRLYFTRLNSIVGQLSAEGSIIPATTSFAVADLPSAVALGPGARAFVSDGLAPAFGASVVGGGAVPVPVYSDGTTWKVG